MPLSASLRVPRRFAPRNDEERKTMTPTTHILPIPNSIGEKGTHSIAVYDWGNPNAQRVVMCVHGLTRNARDFDFIAQQLAATGRRVLAVSMAGRGESAWLTDPMGYNYASYVADCLAVLDNFHIRDVEWIGTSMGGIVGMMLAASNPKRIKKLVLNDIGALLSKEALARIYDYVRTMPTQFETRAEAESYLRNAFAPWGIVPVPCSPLEGEPKPTGVLVGGEADPQTPTSKYTALFPPPNPKTDLAPPQGGSRSVETIWQRFVETSLITREGSLRYACDPAIAVPLAVGSKNFTEVSDVDLRPIWNQLQTPTLVIRGANSDILSDETVKAMRATNLNAESLTYPNVGHAPALMTDADTKPILNWLDRTLGDLMAVSF